jgi:hypothetical protein
MITVGELRRMIQNVSDDTGVECWAVGSEKYEIELARVGLSSRNELSLGLTVKRAEADDDDDDFDEIEEESPPPLQ